MQVIKIAIILLTFIYFTGCQKKPNIPSKEIPLWYINAPQNNENKLFGIGIGETLNYAKTSALENLAERLIVTITSSSKVSLKTDTDGTNQNYTKTITKDITQTIEKISFTNIKISKSTQMNGDYYILIEVDKQKLKKQQREEFEHLNNTIDTQIKTSQNFPPLKKYFYLNNLQKNISESIKKIKILEALDTKFNTSFYISKYNKYLHNLENIKKTTPFQVKSNLKSKYFQQHVQNLLTNKQFILENNQSPKNATIEINSQVRNSKLYGWYIVKVTTTIFLKYKNTILNNKTIESVGRSSISQNNAIHKAGTNFKIKLEKIGIEDILFSK